MEILFFYTPWCKKCPEQLSLLKDVVAGRLPIVEVNLEEDWRLRVNYSVRNIPAIIIRDTEDDSMIERVQGVLERFQMENLISNTLQDAG